MSSCRPAITRTLPRALSRRTAPNKTIIAIRPLTTTTSNKMSAFFPRTLYGADPSFTPLFRLLDDFDNYSREVGSSTTNANNANNGRHGRHGHVRAFNPKFDVRETEEAYELHGELPGIARDNVGIEFTEPQTLVVRGRVERSYTSGTPPASLDGGAAKAAITEGGESAPAHQQQHSHKASVADEEFENVESASTTEKPATSNNEVAKHDKKAEAPAAPEPREKYWVSERSVGEFSRTFSFPGRVDQDAVTANLNNGILSIVVPKAKKAEARRIAIN
jgi:HSP20 family molecular chaperone IbpA